MQRRRGQEAPGLATPKGASRLEGSKEGLYRGALVWVGAKADPPRRALNKEGSYGLGEDKRPAERIGEGSMAVAFSRGRADKRRLKKDGTRAFGCCLLVGLRGRKESSGGGPPMARLKELLTGQATERARIGLYLKPRPLELRV